MAYRSNNLITGRQLRAARALAGMTQRDLAGVLGVNERAVRFWERKHDRPQHRRRMMRVSSRPCSLMVWSCLPNLLQGLGSPKSGNFSYPNAHARDRKPEYPPYVDRSAATGKCCREIQSAIGEISGENIPGRPNRQFLELWKMPGGFEAVSLLAGPGIGTKYLSIGRHCVGRVSHGAGQFREYIIFRLRLKIVS
jgi:hypothetical protein